MDDKFRAIFNRIRRCQLCVDDRNIIHIPEPGWFGGNKILFIAQNPGYPKPDKIEADKVIVDPDTPDDLFHYAYISAQKSWKFYQEFICKIIDVDDFSIINVCRCPTQYNAMPSDTMVKNCVPYLHECIALIEPINIVVLGNLGWPLLNTDEYKAKYNIIFTKHYSYWLKSDPKEYAKELERIKSRLK